MELFSIKIRCTFQLVSTVKEITTAINSFSEEYRIPFSMHVAGYKYHEIAEKMDLPLGTVKSRIFFARQRLQEMLKDYK